MLTRPQPAWLWGQGDSVTPTRRGLLVGGGACLLTAAVGETASARQRRVPAHTDTTDDRRRVDPDAVFAVEGPRRIALTFDDGPDPAYTPAVLTALAAAGMHATFFLIGRNAERYPDLVDAIRAGGHTIGNHTHDHLWLDALARPAIDAQLTTTQRTLVTLGATPGDRFRPPRGWTSPAVVASTAAAGLRCYYWTLCLESRLKEGPAAGARSLLGDLESGAIVLMHDGGHLDGPNPQSIDRSRTVAALPAIIDGIQQRGFTPVTL
ncbi:polysaccharide deacetylase family protein [Nostocoides vanveenii]|uniref:NodB homology domain-containing protein n=1 Tax=Nostocoides vanveenii TaxID=330835 RepID=A0ABP4WXS4_9MICO